jgi:hypothetical protein
MLMNTNLPLCPDFFPVQPTITVSQDSAAAEGKTPLSPVGACLFSFVVSGLATLLVCALAPVRPISLPLLPKDLQGSSKTKWRPPVLIEMSSRNSIHLFLFGK